MSRMPLSSESALCTSPSSDRQCSCTLRRLSRSLGSTGTGVHEHAHRVKNRRSRGGTEHKIWQCKSADRISARRNRQTRRIPSNISDSAGLAAPRCAVEQQPSAVPYAIFEQTRPRRPLEGGGGGGVCGKALDRRQQSKCCAGNAGGGRSGRGGGREQTAGGKSHVSTPRIGFPTQHGSLLPHCDAGTQTPMA
eukprot:scaffold12984_cov125-Isochrysis_galbana.AAC.2